MRCLGFFFWIANIATDVSLHSMLQDPLCDLHCEGFIKLLIACVYAPRSLNLSNENYNDNFASYLNAPHTLFESSKIFRLLWSVVLVCTIVGLSTRFHHPVYCKPLSSIVAFMLCIGGPADRVVMSFAAYLLPAFPAKVKKNDTAPRASSCSAEEPELEWGFFDVMEVAKATSLSLNQSCIEDEDLHAAMAASATEAAETLEEEVLHDLPEFVRFHKIPGSGWCFYDCVLKHLFPNGQEGTENEEVTKAMMAGLCISCMAQRREQLEDFFVDSEEFQSKRILSLRRVSSYRRYVNMLDEFQVYVLDKLETVCNPPSQLDTHQYADSFEIEAFRHTFELSMLRLRPFGTWLEDNLGLLQTVDTEVIRNEEHLRTLLAKANVDLKLLHHQYSKFEHYSVISSCDRGVGMTDEKKNELLHAIAQSSLLQCLVNRNVGEFRRNALLLVGIEAGSALNDDSASDADSSVVSLAESVEESEESDSKSISGDSVIEENSADRRRSPLPADVPVPMHPRVRANPFSESRRSICSWVDPISEPLGARTAMDAPVQDIIFYCRE